MDQHGSDCAWAPAEVALREAPVNLAAEPSSVAAEPGAALSRPVVLARLPDLGVVEPGEESAAKRGRFDGRILSHGLSTKLLVGGGVLLVLAAVFPFVFNNNGAPKPGEPPAPDAKEAPIWNGEAAETTDALSPSANISYEPKMSFSPDLPPAPDFINAAQAPSSAPSPQAPPADGRDGAGAIGNPEQTPAAERQSRTATGQPQARANQMMTIGDSMPTPAGIYVDDYRRDYQANSRANLPARYPACSIPYPMVEPGIARLEGIIEKPSVRTSYDAARSSVH